MGNAPTLNSPSDDDAPRLAITIQELSKAPDHLNWHLVWTVENLAEHDIAITEAWLPHSGFHAERQVILPPQDIGPTGSALLDCFIRCSAGPGDVVENAFLILQTRFHRRAWRVFARLHVERPSPESLTATVEKITTQPVGFNQPARGDA